MNDLRKSASEPPRFKFNSDAQARAHFARHRIVLLGGGVGSGKTVLHGLWVIDRSATETDQLHAIFTNTQNQLEKAVLPEIARWLGHAGIEWTYDKRPPAAWFRRWEREGIQVPAGIARYRNIFTADTGLHVLCGTLFNQSFSQYESLQFGSIRIEEAINNTFAAITRMIERLRCGAGPEVCLARHRHQAFLNFNPPTGPHPWLYSWLDQLEEAARRHYTGEPLNHRNWPLLKRGVGDAVLIQSKTSDNVKNLGHGYETGLAANYSKDTARRRLEGEILRDTAGRACTEFSEANIHPVKYDPDRELFLFLDFNSEPRAATFGHELVEGEYPTQFKRAGLKHVGVFGEYFWADKLSDRKFALDLVRGGRGNGFDSQPRYRDEELRGLPANWQGLKAHRGRIIAYGDAVGRHRSSHSDNLESSWEIVNQVFQQLTNYGWDVPEDGNPSVRARIDAFNGKCLNAFDESSFWIDARCEETIRDCEQVMWDDDGISLREWRRGSMGTEWHRTHCLDGLTYGIHRRYDIGSRNEAPPDAPRIYRRRTERPNF